MLGQLRKRVIDPTDSMQKQVLATNGFTILQKDNLTNRKLDKVDRGRSRMANMTVFNQHFNLLEEVLEKLDLKNKPNSIFNCDESMVAMDRRTGKVVVSRNTKQATVKRKEPGTTLLWMPVCRQVGWFYPPPFPHNISAVLPIRSIWKRWTWWCLILNFPQWLHGLGTILWFLEQIIHSPNTTYRRTKASNTWWSWLPPFHRFNWTVQKKQHTYVLPATPHNPCISTIGCCYFPPAKISF